MSMPKYFLVTCMTFVCIGSITASAADWQRWTVQIVDDTAVFRATKNTEYKFVKATITALQDAGTERFTLRVMEPNDKVGSTKRMYSIQIINDRAEIAASTDLPYKYLETTIRQLKDSGIKDLKITSFSESTGEAAPRR